jgi:hypothetical protein
MVFRQFLKDETACASYLFGCKTVGERRIEISATVSEAIGNGFRGGCNKPVR